MHTRLGDSVKCDMLLAQEITRQYYTYIDFESIPTDLGLLSIVFSFISIEFHKFKFS